MTQLQEATITVLVENTAGSPDLIGEHGLSMWIDTGRHRVLFDTGQGPALTPNARALKVDLGEADAIVLSHGHYDHAGGLSAAMQAAPAAKLFLHPAALERKFSVQNTRARSIGLHPSIEKAIRSNPEQMVLTTHPTTVVDGITVTGEVPRTTIFEDSGASFFLDSDGSNPDTLLDDMGVFFQVPSGVVLLAGCAHSGIVNMMRYVSKLTGCETFLCVMGGIHLLNASQERIERTIDAFREFGVQRIGLGHCTGSGALSDFRRAFPDLCFPCSAGTKVAFE